MVYVLREIPIPLPDDLVRIDEGSFRQYMMWQDDRKTVNKFIASRFEEGLLKTVPYNDENRPEKEVFTIKNIGGLEISVRTTPTHKRTSYASVYQKFKGFIEAIEEFSKYEMLKGDFRIFRENQEELYVTNGLILGKLNEYKEKSLEGKEGVQQELKLVKPEEFLTKTPYGIQLVLDRNYGAVTEYNATKWQEALNMIKEGERRTVGYKVEGSREYVKKFKRLVLEDSLQTLGEEPKEPVALVYPFETSSMKHQIEPREITDYPGIINLFIKEAPEKIRSNSRIGDLILLKMMEQGIEQKILEKGLVNEDFIKDYDPKREDGKMYIRIQGLKKRAEEYYRNNKSSSLEQNFYILLPRQ